MELSKREQLAHLIVKVLSSRFSSFPEDIGNNRNAPFHEAFLKAFTHKLESRVSDIPYLISLSSWLHGLNTTLGQSFFEGAAYILSDGSKREFTTASNTQLNWNTSQERIINEHVIGLRNSHITPTATIYDDILAAARLSEPHKGAPNFTVDVFFEDDDVVHAVEIKTVKPNAGIMLGEKLKILQAKAALMHLYPNKRIEFFMGFPFDPMSTADIEYDKSRFLASIVDGTKYFSPSEILLAGEMWDYFSGEQHTMETMLNLINNIATPAFENELNFLNTLSQRKDNPTRYLEIAQRWQLFSEVEFVINDERIRNNITSTSDQRNYNKAPFNIKGKYDMGRYHHLLRLL